MTYTANRPEDVREARVRVRVPHQAAESLFQGWGPKF